MAKPNYQYEKRQKDLAKKKKKEEKLARKTQKSDVPGSDEAAADPQAGEAGTAPSPQDK